MGLERWLAAALLAALMGIGCAAAEMQREEPESGQAVRRQMQVKSALLDAEDVAAAPIRLEYSEGTLRLTGFVETEAERQRAAAIARQAVPELTVINELQVWAPAQP